MPFSRAALKDRIAHTRAVEYVADYLNHLRAASMLIEDPYVDRHYLDEFSTYYARSHKAPSPICSRFHFFSASDTEVERLLAGAYLGELELSQRALRDVYLGFVVVRPLRGAELGRTVLRTYEVDGRRRYEVVRPYLVHLGGVELTIEGLAYQQQDGGAAVCASTALWSALQKVAHMAGERTPTPTEVTRAAKSPFPASYGLDFPHMAGALSELGYIADLLVPTDPVLFRADVVSALRSHLPVILCLTHRNGTEGHAVTVTGYSEPSHVIDVPIPSCAGAERVPMSAGSLSVIYVHDDNLGSHAHYELWDEPQSGEGPAKLMLKRGRAGEEPPSWWHVDDWSVHCALVPKPNNLRMTVQTLQPKVLELVPVFQEVFAPDEISLSYETRFASAVGYKQSLLRATLERTVLRKFVEALALPRYVGIVSARAPGVTESICDVILDVSEVDRDPSALKVLAMVAPGVEYRSPAHKGLLDFCTAMYRVPLITGPRTREDTEALRR